MADRTLSMVQDELAQAKTKLAQAYKDLDSVDKSDIKSLVTIAGTIQTLEGVEGKRGTIAKLEAEISNLNFAEKATERVALVTAFEDSLDMAFLKSLNVDYGLKSITIDLEPEVPTVSIKGSGSTPKSTGPRAPRSNTEREKPAVGTVLKHSFTKGARRGEVIECVATETGYSVDGTEYPSISAAAKAISGQVVNGWAFFGIA